MPSAFVVRLGLAKPRGKSSGFVSVIEAAQKSGCTEADVVRFVSMGCVTHRYGSKGLRVMLADVGAAVSRQLILEFPEVRAGASHASR